MNRVYREQDIHLYIWIYFVLPNSWEEKWEDLPRVENS